MPSPFLYEGPTGNTALDVHLRSKHRPERTIAIEHEEQALLPDPISQTGHSTPQHKNLVVHSAAMAALTIQ
ncbi:hypothetical protein BJ956_003731 [Arthrobacter psychrochitiniphilus]|nr:hypothetical protein [Arthrobacter psychrochitiniphilus]